MQTRATSGDLRPIPRHSWGYITTQKFYAPVSGAIWKYHQTNSPLQKDGGDFDHHICIDTDDDRLQYAGTHHSITSENPMMELEGRESVTLDFGLCAAGDLHDHYPHASTNFLVCAASSPFFDAGAALNSFSPLLRPGGTLALWLSGRPQFGHREGTQQQYHLVPIEKWRSILHETGPSPPGAWKRAAARTLYGLDIFVLDPPQWYEVSRYKWEKDGRRPLTWHHVRPDMHNYLDRGHQGLETSLLPEKHRSPRDTTLRATWSRAVV